jgi:hypothetical protein
MVYNRWKKHSPFTNQLHVSRALRGFRLSGLPLALLLLFLLFFSTPSFCRNTMLLRPTDGPFVYSARNNCVRASLFTMSSDPGASLIVHMSSLAVLPKTHEREPSNVRTLSELPGVQPVLFSLCGARGSSLVSTVFSLYLWLVNLLTSFVSRFFFACLMLWSVRNLG